MEQQSSFGNFIRSKKVLGAAVLLVVAAIIVSVSSGGGAKFTITTDSNEKGVFVYEFRNLETKKVTSTSTDKNSLSVSLKKGMYEVVVTHNDRSYMTVTEIGNGAKSINATLLPEQRRSYVGDSPGACELFLRPVLLSYTCSQLSQAVLYQHIPATASAPTYVKTFVSPGLGMLQGTADTAEGTVALFGQEQRSRADFGKVVPTNYSVYLYDVTAATFKPRVSKSLTALDKSKKYSIMSYKTGFLVYTSDFTSALYYSSTNAQPQTIDLGKASTPGFTATMLSASPSGQIVVSYSPDSGADIVDKNKRHEVALVLDGKITRRTLTKSYTKIYLCGDDRLCLFDSIQGTLEVQDLTTQKNITTLFGVTKVAVNADRAVFVRSTAGVYGLNTKTLVGEMLYSYGNFKDCGFFEAPGGYTVCISDTKGVQHVVYLENNATNTDSIDKKVAAIQANSLVTAVSIYGKYIYITPVGVSKYNSATRVQITDPVTAANNQKSINDVINSIGLDRNAYSIIFTAPR